MKNFSRTIYLKFARFRRASKAPVPSIVSVSTKIKGDILAGDIIQIDGKLEGNISCQELIIGLQGTVVGEVKAKNLSVYGALQGSAEVDSMFVASTARMLGNVYHKSLAVEPGAYIEGNCVHLPRSEASHKGVVTPINAANGYKMQK